MCPFESKQFSSISFHASVAHPGVTVVRETPRAAGAREGSTPEVVDIESDSDDGCVSESDFATIVEKPSLHCDHCEYQTTHRDLLIGHVAESHKEEVSFASSVARKSVPLYRCEACDFSTTKLNERAKHRAAAKGHLVQSVVMVQGRHSPNSSALETVVITFNYC